MQYIVVPFNFGEPPDIPPNIAVVNASIEISKELNAPIFFSPEEGMLDFKGYANTILWPLDGYPSTLKQATRLLEFVIARGWKLDQVRPVVVAASVHSWRCKRDLQKLGFTVLVDKRLGERFPRNFWYCKRSKHHQTTSWFRWWFTWEIPARVVNVLCFPIYRYLTG